MSSAAASMASTVVPPGAHAGASYRDEATLLRVRLNAELGQLQKDLSQSLFNDPLTQKFKSWVADFQAAMKTRGDLKETFNRFVADLKEMLSHVSCVVLPLNVLPASSLNNRPDQPMECMIKWLYQHGQAPTCEEAQALYDKWTGSNSRPETEVPPPSLQGAAAAAGNGPPAAQVRATEVPPSIHPEDQEFLALFQSEIAKLHDALSTQSVQNTVALQGIRQEFERHINAAAADLETLNREITQLEQDLDGLKAGQQKLQGGIQLVQEQNARIARLIAENKRALEEKNRKKAKKRRFWKTVVAVGLTIAGTYLLATIGPGVLGVSPVSGGARAIVIIPLG